MTDELREQLASAVVLALSRVDLVRRDQIDVLELATRQLKITEDVDQYALAQLVLGEDGMN